MEYLLDRLDPHYAWAPAVALLGLLAALVAVINWQGRKLSKHDELIALLDVRVGNIHRSREATRVRRMQNPLVPPPLPPRAPTIDATDWRDDDQPTEDLSLRNTVRYPLGEPPTEDDP